MVARHNMLCDVLAETCHCAYLSIQVKAGNCLTSDHSHIRPSDILLSNWTTGRTAAFDISVTSPLNTLTLMCLPVLLSTLEVHTRAYLGTKGDAVVKSSE